MRTRTYLPALAVILLASVMVGQTWVRANNSNASAGKNKLAVVWTSGDSEVAHNVCLMYAHAAKNAKWFDEVTLIVWGPSSRLLAGDTELQAKIKRMMASGVVVQACVVCADTYGIADDLRAIGIEVKGMGKPLSDLLKADWKVLTF